MKNLPRIDHWVEWIDDGKDAETWTFAAFAQRCWDTAPRYSVFLIVTCDPMKRWDAKQSAFRALDIELERFEAKLHQYWGNRFLGGWQRNTDAGVALHWKAGEVVEEFVQR